MEHIDFLQPYFDRMSPEGIKAIEKAKQYCSFKKVEILTTDHILIGCLENQVVREILKINNLGPSNIAIAIDNHYKNNPSNSRIGRIPIDVSKNGAESIRRSFHFWEGNSHLSKAPYGPSCLVAGILEVGHSMAAQCLTPLTPREYARYHQMYCSAHSRLDS